MDSFITSANTHFVIIPSAGTWNVLFLTPCEVHCAVLLVQQLARVLLDGQLKSDCYIWAAIGRTAPAINTQLHEIYSGTTRYIWTARQQPVLLII